MSYILFWKYVFCTDETQSLDFSIKWWIFYNLERGESPIDLYFHWSYFVGSGGIGTIKVEI